MGVVRAAGGVVVREGATGAPEILLVHRPRYDDWTLPKGKAARGETDEECARREVEEETGLVCDVGAEIAVTEYEDSAGRPKRVRYFWMPPPPGAEARPRNEVDDVRWVQPDAALALLSYARDYAVVEAVSAFSAR
jgi:8-oxo-dGTP pyrophosphatase MutT (NUDIX family)